MAGTDDDVWLDIGDRTFVLDTLNHDDRERGNREGYAIWAPDLSLDQIKRIMIRKSSDGFASQHPANDLSWVYDLQFPKIDAPNGTDNATNCPCLSALEAGWRDPAMAQINYNGNTYSAAWSSVAEFREDMRLENLSKHAIVIFVTPYASCWHAYAGQRRLVLAKRNNWGNWGRAALDSITAHEVCHLFGAADEYTGSGTPCRVL